MESGKEDYPVALLLGIQENIEGRFKWNEPQKLHSSQQWDQSVLTGISLYFADDHFLEHEKEGI